MGKAAWDSSPEGWQFGPVGNKGPGVTSQWCKKAVLAFKLCTHVTMVYLALRV